MFMQDRDQNIHGLQEERENQINVRAEKRAKPKAQSEGNELKSEEELNDEAIDALSGAINEKDSNVGDC